MTPRKTFRYLHCASLVKSLLVRPVVAVPISRKILHWFQIEALDGYGLDVAVTEQVIPLLGMSPKCPGRFSGPSRNAHA
jgi:hypothetical protein